MATIRELEVERVDAPETAVVPRDEAEAYELADRIDAELIARSLAGVPVDILCYKFRTANGQIASGVTAKGALVLAAAMARQGRMHLTELKPEIEDKGETYYVMVAVKNLDNEVTLYGMAEAPKMMQRRDGSTEPDRFALAKAHAIARRRAIMAHFAGEEKLIQAFVEDQQRQGRTIVGGDSRIMVEAAVAQRQAEAGYVPRIGPEEGRRVREAANAAGVTERQIAAYIFKRWGARKVTEVPVDGLEELLKWIRSHADEGSGEAPEEAPTAQEAEARTAEAPEGEAKSEDQASELPPAPSDSEASPSQGDPRPNTNRSRRKRDAEPMSGNVSRPKTAGDQETLL